MNFFNIFGTLVTSMKGSLAKWPRNRPTTTVCYFIYILKVKCQCLFNSIREKYSLEFQKAEEEVSRSLDLSDCSSGELRNGSLEICKGVV